MAKEINDSAKQCCSLMADTNSIVDAQSDRITAIARQADTLGQMADILVNAINCHFKLKHSLHSQSPK